MERRRRGWVAGERDGRRSDLARHATYFLQFKPDTDVALLNAMAAVVISEHLADEVFLAAHVEGLDRFASFISGWPPERARALKGRLMARVQASRAAGRELRGHWRGPQAAQAPKK